MLRLRNTTEYSVYDKITYHYDTILTHNVYFNNERTQTIRHTKECYKTFFLLNEKYNT